MQTIQIIDGKAVIDLNPGTPKSLTPEDFAGKDVVVKVEPAFYVALGENGLLVRTVSVALEDRKTVAALVGNWIAEGFTPVPCDIKTFAKHVAALNKAQKAAAPVKTEDGAPTGDGAAAGGAPAGDAQGSGASTDTSSGGAAAGENAAPAAAPQAAPASDI